MVVFKAKLYISVWAFVFAPITLFLWPFHFHFPMSAISHSFHFHFPMSPFSSSIQLAFPFLVSVSQLSARWQLCSSSFRHSGSCWHCTARGYRHCIQIYKYTNTQTQIHKYKFRNTQIQLCPLSFRHSGSCCFRICCTELEYISLHKNYYTAQFRLEKA